MQSAKYSWSGSLDRFAKGRTTIDRRGVDLASMAGGRCALAAAGAGPAVGGDWAVGRAGVSRGQLHHAAAMTTTASAPAAPNIVPLIRRNRRGLAAIPIA